MKTLLSILAAAGALAGAAWLSVSASDPAPAPPSPAAPPSPGAAAAKPAAEKPAAASAKPNLPAPKPAPKPVSKPPTPAASKPAPAVVPTVSGPPTPTVTRRPVPIPSRARPKPAPTKTSVKPKAAPSPAATPPIPVLPTPSRPRVTPAAPPSPGAGNAAAGAAAGAAAAPAGAEDEGQPPIPPPPGTDGVLSPDDVVPAGSLQFQALPLEQVLMYYAELTGRTVLRPSSLPDTPITLKTQTDLTRKEATEALDSVLALNNISMVPTGDKFVTAIPSNQVTQEAPRFVEGKAEDLPEASQYITKVVTLKHLVPSEAAQVIQGFGKVQNGIVPLDESKTLIIRDYAANVKRMLEILERMDVEKEFDYKLEVIPIKYGKVDAIYSTMSSLISGGGAPSTSSSSSRGGLSSGLRSGGFNSGFGGGFGSRYGSSYGGSRYGSSYGGSRYGGYGGSAGGYGGGYRPYQVTSGPATSRSSSSSFSQRLRQIVNKASGKEEVEILQDARIVPDERSNSLIVFANKKDMTMITNIVSKVDRLLAQVLIEAVIMDVSLSDDFTFGVSAYLKNQSGKWNNDFLMNPNAVFSGVTNLASGNPSGLSWLGNYNDDMTVVVQAIASTGKGQIVATPRIQTSHAMEASFSVGESVPYVTSTYYGSFTGPSSSFSQLNVNNTLDVIPYITPDNLVVMDIAQHIEEITGFKKFEGVGELPQTVNRDAQATVSVRDGDTIILGGYVREARNRNHSGVPILKDIPLLGALFRTKTTKSSRSEMVVFIRPTVLSKPTDAAAFARHEKETMPGISQMERMMKEDQDRLRKQTDKLDRKP